MGWCLVAFGVVATAMRSLALPNAHIAAASHPLPVTAGHRLIQAQAQQQGLEGTATAHAEFLNPDILLL